MESVAGGTITENQSETVQNQSEIKELTQEEDLNQPDEEEDHKLGQEDDVAQSQKKEKLTEKQIEEIENNTIDNVQVKIAKMKSTKDFDKADEDGHFPVPSRNLTIALYSSYFALKNAPLDKIMILRRKISNIMIELKAADVICEIFKYYTNHGYTHEVDGVEKVDLIKTRPFINSILVLLNFTDASDELAVYIANYPEMLESIRHVLVESKEQHLSNEEKKNSAKITKNTVSLTHNISMKEATVTRLRDLNFTSAIQPFLQSPNEMIQLTALATLACIANEKESEVINTNQGTVKIPLKCLEKGLKSKLRRHNGWSCNECALTVRMLARNDANKNILAELGAVEILVKVAQTVDEEEKYESVHALWSLAFDPEVRKQMVANKDLGLVDLLEDIKLSCKLPAIKKACEGVLWLMREELKASSIKKYQQLADYAFTKEALITETITPEAVTHVTWTPKDTVDSQQVHHPVRRPNFVSLTTLSKVRQWQPSDVELWIYSNDLKACGVSQLTGGELALLLTMRQEAPEYFYKCLETMLNVNSLFNMSKIVWALTDLAEQQ